MTVKSTLVFSIMIIVPALFTGMRVCAHEVVMKTGERFNTSEVWEENGKVIFDMQGLTVNVDKDEVASIVRDTDTQPLLNRPKGQQFDFKSKIERNSNSIASDEGKDRNADRFALRSNKMAPIYPNRSADSRNRQPPFDLGTGFNDIEWQMGQDQLPNLEKVETDPAFGGIDQYWIPEQPLRWGWADLNGWVYGFWQDQLYSIMMWANGPGAYENLLKQAFKTFGPGMRNVDNEERYVWDEPSTQRMLEYDSRLGVGIFIMRSSKLDTQIKELYPD